MLYDGKPGPINRKTVNHSAKPKERGFLCSEDDSAMPYPTAPGILKSQANQNSTRFYCHALFHSTPFYISSSFIAFLSNLENHE